MGDICSPLRLSVLPSGALPARSRERAEPEAAVWQDRERCWSPGRGGCCAEKDAVFKIIKNITIPERVFFSQSLEAVV